MEPEERDKSEKNLPSIELEGWGIVLLIGLSLTMVFNQESEGTPFLAAALIGIATMFLFVVFKTTDARAVRFFSCAAIAWSVYYLINLSDSYY